MTCSVRELDGVNHRQALRAYFDWIEEYSSVTRRTMRYNHVTKLNPCRSGCRESKCRPVARPSSLAAGKSSRIDTEGEQPRMWAPPRADVRWIRYSTDQSRLANRPSEDAVSARMDEQQKRDLRRKTSL